MVTVITATIPRSSIKWRAFSSMCAHNYRRRQESVMALKVGRSSLMCSSKCRSILSAETSLKRSSPGQIMFPATSGNPGLMSPSRRTTCCRGNRNTAVPVSTKLCGTARSTSSSMHRCTDLAINLSPPYRANSTNVIAALTRINDPPPVAQRTPQLRLPSSPMSTVDTIQVRSQWKVPREPRAYCSQRSLRC